MRRNTILGNVLLQTMHIGLAVVLLLQYGAQSAVSEPAASKDAVALDRSAGFDSALLELSVASSELPDDYTIRGAVNWKDIKGLTEFLYIDSDGHFKRDWAVLLGLEADKHGIDPLIVYELLKIESGETFDPDAVGPETRYGQAYGLAQFMENTGPWIAEKAGMDYEKEKLFDPHYAIQLSVTYLSYLYDKYEDWDHALTAYHRGMTGLEKYIDENGDAASWYAVEIQENAELTASGRQ